MMSLCQKNEIFFRFFEKLYFDLHVVTSLTNFPPFRLHHKHFVCNFTKFHRWSIKKFSRIPSNHRQIPLNLSQHFMIPLLSLSFSGLHSKHCTRSHQKLKNTTFSPAVRRTTGFSIMRIASNQIARVWTSGMRWIRLRVGDRLPRTQ